MPEITCSRCGRKTEGLADAPFGGKLGKLVHAQACPACWAEWEGMLRKIINEYRLTLAIQAHYDMVMDQLRAFLQLKDPDAKPAAGAGGAGGKALDVGDPTRAGGPYKP